jgi:hypothetical protein
VKEKLTSTSWRAAFDACIRASEHAVRSRRLALAEDILKRAERFRLEYNQALYRELESCVSGPATASSTP